MMVKFALFSFFLLIPQFSFSFGIDLHAHLFMNEGVNGIYFGKFFSPKIVAKKWNHAKRSQVNESLLKDSDLSIVVVSLYAAPILAGETVYQSIHKQIDQAELFVKRNPKWIIGRSSGETLQALKEGKKVMILSVEGGAGVVNTSEQIKALYQRGLRIVTLLHLTPDKLGSPAFLDPLASFFTMPRATILCHDRDDNNIRINCQGLTPMGSDVADQLMDAGIWIDLSHASDLAMDELLNKHQLRNLPLLFTHGSLRSKLGQERGVSLKTLEHFKQLGGIFGLTPSKKLLGKTDHCHGTIDAFKEHYDILGQYLEPDQIAIGTDTNGMIDHIKPRNENDSCNPGRIKTEFDRNGGWWNFSHTMPLWTELKRMDNHLPDKNSIIKRFLREWSRIEKYSK
jgi:microsomal dipeptidase-like Zn-dependent dipeptidase